MQQAFVDSPTDRPEDPRARAPQSDREHRHGTEADQLMTMIYQRHVPALLQYLVRLSLGNRPTAEDLLQETLLRAWRNIDQLVAAPGAVRPWLFTVARNQAIDGTRYRRARPPEVSMDPARVSAGHDEVDRMLTATTLREALGALSPEHRAVVIELYFKGVSLAEAAERVGVPVGTVKSRAYYALRALRVVIGPIDGC